MDWQYLFNLLAGAFGAVAGWLLHTLWNAVDSLRADVNLLERNATERYVRRDDFQQAIAKLDQKLDKIFDRLDRKADRE